MRLTQDAQWLRSALIMTIMSRVEGSW